MSDVIEWLGLEPSEVDFVQDVAHEIANNPSHPSREVAQGVLRTTNAMRLGDWTLEEQMKQVLEQIDEAQRLVAACEADAADREEHENSEEWTDIKILLDGINVNLRDLAGVEQERY